jgi:Raf kinase inhibitor-like YbhB/YbcL family protein
MKNKLIFTTIVYFTLGDAAMAMDIKSSSIQNGILKKESACSTMGGQDQSPALQINNLPEGTEYLAIIMDDPDAKPIKNKTFVHWNVFNVISSETSIDSGISTSGEVLANSNGEESYTGMCPPNGRHTYRIGVFALKSKIDTTKAREMTIEKMEKDYGDKIIEKAVIKGAWG